MARKDIENTRPQPGPTNGEVAKGTKQPSENQERKARQISDAVEGLNRLRQELIADWSGNEGTLRTGDETCSEEDQPGERASQDVRIAELGFLASALRDVDEAITRARDGRYGVCVDCGKPIAARRLKANPTASRCTDCQTAAEWPTRRAPTPLPD